MAGEGRGPRELGMLKPCGKGVREHQGAKVAFPGCGDVEGLQEEVLRGFRVTFISRWIAVKTPYPVPVFLLPLWSFGTERMRVLWGSGETAQGMGYFQRRTCTC